MKKKIGLSFLVVTLALLVAFSFVAISHLLIKTGRANPYTSVDISADANNKLGIGTSEFKTSGVVGLAFDKMAMGICLEKIKMTSNYTACADFWNEFTHVLVNYLLDTNCNIVAFVLD